MSALTVKDLMTPNPVVLDIDDDLRLAEEIFQFGRLRHLPVVKNGRLVGLVSHRDFLRAIARHARDGRAQTAGEVMTRQVTAVNPETSARKALRLMVHNKFGCLPVVRGHGKLVGILTETDACIFAARVLKELDRLDEIVQQLVSSEAYRRPEKTLVHGLPA